jgi:hypothetical protein
MAWTRSSGLPGKIFIPDEENRAPQKHHCQNCYSCQWCEENRCNVCRCENDNETENQETDRDIT